MSEKLKSRLAILKEKFQAILWLPDCVFNEILLRLKLKNDKEQEYRAQHEAGHALVYLLAGKSIERAEISRLQGITCEHLNMLLGSVVPFHAGEVSLSDSEETKFAQEEPAKNVLNYLAGIASTQDPSHKSFFEKLLEDGLIKGIENDWEDISVPYAYIEERFQAIHGREPTKGEVSNIFHALLKDIKTLFSKPQFAKALTQIKQLIKKHRLKKAINETILRSLNSNGLSTTFLEEMQRALFTIDIDKIIQTLHQ